jgi:hypothetical protein
MSKIREFKEDYILAQIEKCDLPDRIKVLKMIIDKIGTGKIEVVKDGTLLNMDDIPDQLLDDLVAFMKDREQACRIDMGDCSESCDDEKLTSSFSRLGK